VLHFSPVDEQTTVPVSHVNAFLDLLLQYLIQGFTMPSIFSHYLSSHGGVSSSRVQKRKSSFGHSSIGSTSTFRSGGSSALGTSMSTSSNSHRQRDQRVVAFYSNQEYTRGMNFADTLHFTDKQSRAKERAAVVLQQRHDLQSTQTFEKLNSESVSKNEVQRPSILSVEEDWGYFVDYIDDRDETQV
jgi:hypothetical protein